MRSPARDGLAVDPDRAALQRLEAEDGAAEGGLAAAALADEAEALALVQGEADAADGVEQLGRAEEPVADGVVADHALDFEERRAGQPEDALGLVRRGGEERAGVGVAHLAEDLRSRAGLDHPAAVHDGEAVGKVGDHREVVGDEHERHAVLVDQPAEELEDLRLGGDVERGGGLVGDQELRAERDRHGDADALALAAGELVRVAARAGSGREGGRRGPRSRRRWRGPLRGRRRGGRGRSRPPGRRWSAAGSARSSAPGRSCRRRGRGSGTSRPRSGPGGRRRRGRRGRWRWRRRAGGPSPRARSSTCPSRSRR